MLDVHWSSRGEIVMSREFPFGYPPHPAKEGRVSVADMAELIGAGEAIQLFPEFNVGPTWWNGEWWYVPQGSGEGAHGYAMADPETASDLSRRFAILQASAQRLAANQEARRAAAEAGRSSPDLGDDDPDDVEPRLHPGDEAPAGPRSVLPRRPRWRWRR